MLSFDDSRWAQLKGGYRVPFDVRPLLTELETSTDSERVWLSLWNELHHQGDVDLASYAAVPHLVRIYKKRRELDWNVYGLLTTIELERGEHGNPTLPGFLDESYQDAFHQLAEIGLSELRVASTDEDSRAILSFLALTKGLRTYGRVLLEFGEDELLELHEQAFGPK